MKVTLALAVAFAVLLAGADAQERRDVPTFASKVELVTVDAVVVDGKGRPVRGLSADDFTLLEDGKPQAIASFEAFDLGDAPEGVTAAAAPTSPVATNLRPASAGGALLRPARGRHEPRPHPAGGGPHRHRALPRGGAARRRRADLRHHERRRVVERADARGTRGRARPSRRGCGAATWATPRGRDQRVGGLPDQPLRERDDRGAESAGAGSPSQGRLRLGAPARPPDREGPGLEHHAARGGALPASAGSATPWPSPMCYSSACAARAQQVDLRRVNRTRDALAAVDRAVFALTGVRGRKALLLLTEGFLNDTDLGLVQEVAGRCREANLVVYSLDVRGLMTGLAGADEHVDPRTRPSWRSCRSSRRTSWPRAAWAWPRTPAASRSANTNDLAAGAARVADESRTYYLLGYAPPEGKGPRDWRKLKVEVKTAGPRGARPQGLHPADDRGDRGGRGRGPAAPSRQGRGEARRRRTARPSRRGSRPTWPAPWPRPTTPTRSPFAPWPTPSTTGPRGPCGRSSPWRPTRRSLANLGGEERRARGAEPQHLGHPSRHRQDPAARPAHRGGRRAAVKAWEGWLALSREFDLPPGVAQARVVVRDEFLGRLGALTVRFVVPPSGGLRLSTPILTDRLSIPPKRQPRPSPCCVAHREFAPPAGSTASSRSSAREHGADRGVEASYELRRANGDVIRQGAATPIAPSPDGRLVRLLALSSTAWRRATTSSSCGSWTRRRARPRSRSSPCGSAPGQAEPRGPRRPNFTRNRWKARRILLKSLGSLRPPRPGGLSTRSRREGDNGRF